MLGEIITIVKTASTVLRRPFEVAARKTRVLLFQQRTKLPPIDEARVKQIAFSVLAGDIIRAVSFRNIDSACVFIACLRRSSAADHDAAIHILGQIGDTFKLSWQSDRLFLFDPSALEVCDVDNDGYHEVVFEDLASGSGAGMKRLTVYMSRHAQSFTITESREWQDRAGPNWPVVEIEPDPDPEMLKTLETLARKRGYLQPAGLVDFEAATFATQRWHKENGRRTSGKINVHYYEGHPVYGASVVVTLETGTMTWISFFKGPVMGYDKLRNRHFVAYSAAWSYNWATCLAFDGETLWFGLHMRAGIMSFSLAESRLDSHESFQGAALPFVSRLEISQGKIILNGTLRIPISSLAESHIQ